MKVALTGAVSCPLHFQQWHALLVRETTSPAALLLSTEHSEPGSSGCPESTCKPGLFWKKESCRAEEGVFAPKPSRVSLTPFLSPQHWCPWVCWAVSSTPCPAFPW